VLIWLFFAFLAVALVLVIFGFAVDFPLFSMVGTIMLFLLGLSLLTGGLSYKIGEDYNYIYGNNFTDYHWDSCEGASEAPSQVDREAFLFHTNSSSIYANYDDASGDRYGWFLLILGALGFCLSLFTLGGSDD